MKRRDVGRHRQGTAFGFARSRRPIRAGGPGSPRGKPGLTRRSSPPPQGGVSRVSRLPVPGATIGAPPGSWRRPRPSRPTAGSARKRLRARTGNGPDPKCEARNQKRRGAGPCRIRRSGSEPCLPIRFARTTRARGHRDTRPALPSRGSRGSRSLTVRPLCPRAPRGIWRACLRPGSPNGGRDRD